MQRLHWFPATALVVALAFSPNSLAQRSVYTVFGQVHLPDGKPAADVIVEISASSGYSAQTITNDQGQYEFSSLPAGRYRLTASDPDKPEIHAESAETDVSRVPGQRVMVHLFFRAVAEAPGKRPERAVVSVTEIAQQVPKDAQRAYERALELKNRGDATRAAANIEKALAIFPTYFQALTLRGELAIRQGRTAEALAAFSEALKINPDFEPALRGSGFCKLQQRKIADAALDLGRAVELNSLDSEAHLYFGIATLALDRRTEARNSLEQALQLAPAGAITARIYLANLHAKEGRYAAAADELRKFLAAQPEAPNADRLRAQEAQWRRLSHQK
ncbi:MAG: tetratricopeptide repeat protein [Acidobacteriota bacterium]